MTNGPLVRPATLSAALLFGDPDALISHRTAAQEWGMVRADPGPVHITIPMAVRPSASRRRCARPDRGTDSRLLIPAPSCIPALSDRYAVDVEQSHALPSARRQSPVVVDGRTLWEDCDYSGCGVPLIVRLDGRRYHSGAEYAFRDRRRDNAAELDGRPRLVYGWDEVSGDACGVAREVVSVLRRGGWEGGGGEGSCLCVKK